MSQKPQIPPAFFISTSGLRFSEFARSRGRMFFSTGAVKSLALIPDPFEFWTRIQDGRIQEVCAFLDAKGKVAMQCSCREPLCAHAYAMGLVLESAIVRERLLNLSDSAAPPPADVLALEVQKALGRPLARDERFWLFGVRHLKEVALGKVPVSLWEISRALSLSFPKSANTWDSIKLFVPSSGEEMDFLHSLAHSLRDAGFELPVFLASLGANPAVELALHRRDREQMVHRWRRHFSGLDLSHQPEPLGTLELQLMVVPEEKACHFFWRIDPAAAFDRLSVSDFKKIDQQFDEGLLQMGKGCSMLWAMVSENSMLGDGVVVRLDTFQRGVTLRMFLEDAQARDRIVGSEGSPLRFESDLQVRWKMEERAGQGGDMDYIFRLEFSDGAPLPPKTLVLPGRPAWYLAASSIYAGPEPLEGVLSRDEQNAVPAEALETLEGLRLLDVIGVPLPERIRSKVRTENLRARVVCGVELLGLRESQVFTVVVQGLDSKDQVLRRLAVMGWVPVAPRKPNGKQAEDALVRYQTQALERFPRLLAPLGLRWDPVTNQFRARLTKKLPETLASWLDMLPKDVEVELPAELDGLDEAAIEARVKLDCTSVDVDWFDLRVGVDVTNQDLSPEEIQLLLEARGKPIRLEGRGWKRLKFDLTEEDNEQLARLGLSARELSGEPQRLHALQLADPKRGRLLPVEQFAQIKERRKEIQARVAPEVPKCVKAELRPYQLEGYHFLAYLSANRFGGILADDMGLGKTLQTLAWVAWLRASQGSKTGPCLVVCPKSVADNWQSEAGRFYPELSVQVFRGADAEAFQSAAKTFGLVVVNYAQMRSLDGVIQKVSWLAVILDEGQFIKNPQSMTAVIARGLSASHRLVLTGTPIENRLLDLWSLMAFAMPGVLGTQSQFTKGFGESEDPHARRRLAARVRPFLIRRTKSQVAKDLPDRTEEDLFCELEGEQLSLYKAEFKYAQKLLLNLKTPKDLDELRFNFLASLMKLRQICCHPALVGAKKSSAPSAKMEALLELLEPLIAEGEKVLVFSQFVELLKLVRGEVEKKKWRSFLLSGETEERGALVKEFQTCEEAAVFLISLKAGGFGLNLTSASYVVLFDPWWNPAVENQAIDRTHRIGQQNKVIAYRLLAKNTIEEKIRKLQRTKSALADDVLGEEKFAKGLSIEDLQYLFAEEASS